MLKVNILLLFLKHVHVNNHENNKDVVDGSTDQDFATSASFSSPCIRDAVLSRSSSDVSKLGCHARPTCG
jgi:hypothetical protein